MQINSSTNEITIPSPWKEPDGDALQFADHIANQAFHGVDLRRQPRLVGGKHAVQRRGTDGEANRIARHHGGDAIFPVDGPGDINRFVDRIAHPTNQRRHVAGEAVGQQIQPCHAR